ncbi:Ecm3p [Saccharomyces cerevisiae x Saccharomyces kudriavzevii VIN7]|uniref:Ecm3p n=1 Tax=Saccharomyces cerevisiae x Saccharomyces kudriavzevii (strain VIN7) TaxID=1095631 RepID=H0H089_SACCK|nr:Ecm3p [Saccharomyces cerevisiae x Saccharomyces kudriavzevii VIN7]
MAKMSILTVEATRIISDIVLTVLLPCLSFNKIVANIEDKDIKSVGIICLSALLIFGTGLFLHLSLDYFYLFPNNGMVVFLPVECFQISVTYPLRIYNPWIKD